MTRTRAARWGAACLLAAGGSIAVCAMPASAAPQGSRVASAITADISCQYASLQGEISTFENCNATLGVHLNETVHVASPVSITYLCTSVTILPATPLSSLNGLGVGCTPISS
ncbi:hypothetical protein ACH4NF_01790 [Streptomyces sp. NPDC017248]|uniref:hypothetical protein n=1 Tax=unclassified Streptomyces TaxID=2593676 RepID=UPI0037B664F5